MPLQSLPSAATLALLALLALSIVTSTTAAPVCSGAVCASESNKLSNNNIAYCCPSSHVTPSATNYGDPSTYSCPSTQDCSQFNGAHAQCACCTQANAITACE